MLIKATFTRFASLRSGAGGWGRGAPVVTYWYFPFCPLIKVNISTFCNAYQQIMDKKCA